jgi:putative transposase
MALTRQIERIHRCSYGIYGSPRIHAQLRHEGLRVARKRVARLMRNAALIGVTRRRFMVTTQRDSSAVAAKDLVKRDFQVCAPDRLWVADITYIPTWSDTLYLAIALDAYSRRIVGWAMETYLRAELVLKALELAYAQRVPAQVIHHSDHGVQYTSVAFGQRCKEMGIRLSMGTVGDCFDNAMAESFFASLECELLDRRKFKDPSEARLAVFEYIEGFYNSSSYYPTSLCA